MVDSRFYLNNVLHELPAYAYPVTERLHIIEFLISIN